MGQSVEYKREGACKGCPVFPKGETNYFPNYRRNRLVIGGQDFGEPLSQTWDLKSCPLAELAVKIDANKTNSLGYVRQEIENSDEIELSEFGDLEIRHGQVVSAGGFITAKCNPRVVMNYMPGILRAWEVGEQATNVIEELSARSERTITFKPRFPKRR